MNAEAADDVEEGEVIEASAATEQADKPAPLSLEEAQNAMTTLNLSEIEDTSNLPEVASIYFRHFDVFADVWEDIVERYKEKVRKQQKRVERFRQLLGKYYYSVKHVDVSYEEVRTGLESNFEQTMSHCKPHSDAKGFKEAKRVH